MSARFIVRVDDVGQALDQGRVDEELGYFRAWWKALHPSGPVYLGIVPAFITDENEEQLASLLDNPNAVPAIHGWDHGDHVLGREDIRIAAQELPDASVVIPPYNKYDASTIEAMQEFRLFTLFGGFDDEHHNYGPAPVIVGQSLPATGGVLHISARRDLYARCYQIVDLIDTIEDPGYPLQIVLHHRWDAHNIRGAQALGEKLRGRMATINEAWRYALQNEK